VESNDRVMIVSSNLMTENGPSCRSHKRSKTSTLGSTGRVRRSREKTSWQGQLATT
jgi:hypothetical protein